MSAIFALQLLVQDAAFGTMGSLLSFAALAHEINVNSEASGGYADEAAIHLVSCEVRFAENECGS